MERMLKKEEEDVLADLQELEADELYHASDSEDTWGDDHKDKDTVACEWEDFFAD